MKRPIFRAAVAPKWDGKLSLKYIFKLNFDLIYRHFPKKSSEFCLNL
jgi:hypothetical protein